ncbi:MAG: hypothetical protein HY807_11270 [Nitrospirae bacterium]|nr:hypothetical protein [Nitrospirota bacterium]
MKKILSGLLVTVLLFTSAAEACVGKILNIGILNSVEENLLAELISVMVNERTGTTVNIKVYKDSKEIYNAVKNEEISIVIENTERALKILGLSGNESDAKAYDVSRDEFRSRLNLIWLKPFGIVNMEDDGGQYYYAPVITEDVLINFPALPRLINKLSDITLDKNYRGMIISIKRGEKARKAAKEFLKKKKLV